MPMIVWIALGGAAGTIGRHYVAVGLSALAGTDLPWGTLLVNVTGSFLLGVLYGIGRPTGFVGPVPYLALTTGFLGGFTTYSTFSLDTFRLLESGRYGSAALYVAATLFGGLLGTALGASLGARGATPPG